ncbi:agglutinin cell wall attachment protein [Nocardioides sp. NPDC059952]|uniref:agglutinin cell wall attachment protein n=1 Tax=Nocardioides sp. NPDC059952 TaxID=3347014 RepID=UPI003656594D
MAQIGPMIPERVEGEWTSVVLRRRAVSMYAEQELIVHRPNGATEKALAPRAVSKLLKELRKVMYTPGGGTWLSLEWTIENNLGDWSGRTSFNYDDEPSWQEPLNPGIYGLDLEDFPRESQNIPLWMQQRLDEARRQAK